MYQFLHVRDGVETLNHFEPQDREVIVMIRGLSRSYRAWMGFHHALSYDFDVICLDLPGLGLSVNVPPTYSVQQMALQLSQVIAQIHIPRLFLVAPSLGALVALEIAMRLPLTQVRGLVLLSPSHTGTGLRRLSWSTLKAMQEASRASEARLVELTQKILIGLDADGQDIAQTQPARISQWCEHMLEDSRELGRKGQIAQITAALRYTSHRALRYVVMHQIPLKFVVPNRDQLIPPAHSRRMYDFLKHPQSAIIELDNAGHDVIVTHARQLEDIVTSFVKDQSTYRMYPLKQVKQAQQASQVRKQVMTSMGLFSLSFVLFSWLFRRRS